MPPIVVHIFFSHVPQCSLFSFSHLSFPIQTFLSSVALSTTLQTIPLSPQPLPLLQCLSQYKDHMRQQSREPKDIRERAVRVTSSLDGFTNVQETHLHYYPFSQEPTHNQTPSGSSLNKLQMGEEVRVHMYMQHLDSSCTLWVYPPCTI